MKAKGNRNVRKAIADFARLKRANLCITDRGKFQRFVKLTVRVVICFVTLS
jgi:hypothetical protein